MDPENILHYFKYKNFLAASLLSQSKNNIHFQTLVINPLADAVSREDCLCNSIGLQHAQICNGKLHDIKVGINQIINYWRTWCKKGMIEELFIGENKPVPQNIFTPFLILWSEKSASELQKKNKKKKESSKTKMKLECHHLGFHVTS